MADFCTAAYNWEPTALLGKYEMVKLQHGVPFDKAEWKRCTTNPDCPDPKRNDWPKDNVETLISSQFAKEGPKEVKDYLSKRSWSNATVDKLLAWMTDNQATGEEGARYFLRNYSDQWMEWVPADVAEKVKSAAM